MKRLCFGLSVALLGILLVTGYGQARSWSKLEQELNPDEQSLWIVIGDKEASQLFREAMKKHGISTWGFGRSGIHAAEGFFQAGYPLVTTFTPDQPTAQVIDPGYHYLFVLPIEEIEEILTEEKCVIASRKVRISVLREIPGDEGGWVTALRTEKDGYITLIAAPNKKSLKKAIARFLKLGEIPLEAIVFN